MATDGRIVGGDGDLGDVMKTTVALFLSTSILLFANSASAGRDPFLILQIERAAAQKRAQQAELEKLQRCWQEHGHLMERQANATKASER